MKFRTKLVVWYGAVVLLTLIAFRVASIGVIRKLLYDDLDSSLRAEARWVERLIRGYQSRGTSDAEIIEEIAERSSLAPRKEFIEVRDPVGQVLFRSPNLEGVSLRPLARPPLGEPSDASIQGVLVRVLVVETPSLQVAVGYPLTDIESAIEKLLDSLLYLIPLAIALAAVGGFLLSARFLAPLKQMEAYADQVVGLPLDREMPPPPEGSDDEIGRLLGRIHDIVSQMRENLRRAIGFSSLASHELRTPLAVLRIQLEGALRPDAEAEELHEAIASTYDEVLRLTSVVKQLLELSTLQAGTLSLDLEWVDAGAFLADFEEEVRPLCESRGVSVILDEGASTILWGDRSRLRQVLFNLLDNALKHVSNGGRIVIGLDEEKDWAVLRVQDDGQGISADQLGRIFDPFYQGSDAARPGVGLGLAFVRWVVEEHRGQVEAESVSGRGTTIRLRFPRANRPPDP